MKKNFYTVNKARIEGATSPTKFDVDLMSVDMISKPVIDEGRSHGWFVSGGIAVFVEEDHLGLHNAWLEIRKTNTFVEGN